MSSSTREEDLSEDVSSLRRTMRDLVALSALPAIWTGYKSERIAESLADVMLRMLFLELIYVTFSRSGATGVTEVARCRHEHDNPENREKIRQALHPWLNDPFASVSAIHIDPQDLAEEGFQVLTILEGIIGGAAVPHHDVQVAVRAKADRAAVMIPERAGNAKQFFLAVRVGLVGVLPADAKTRKHVG